MVWKNSNNTMKAAASFFVKFLLAFAASSAVASAFVTVVPPKIITTHQTHHQPESSTKLAAQNQSHFHQLSSWLSSPTIAAAPIISAATIFALTVFVASYPSPATAAGDVTKGSQIFTSTCAGCHAGGNNFIKEKKTLKKDALEKYVGLEDTKITEFFKKSFVHQNQAGGGKMSEEDVADVISYVITQAVNDKW